MSRVPGLPDRVVVPINRRPLQASLDEIDETGARMAEARQLAALAGDPEHRDRLERWVAALPAGTRFTADDVRRELGASKSTGPVLAALGRRGVIEHSGYRRSRSVTRHGSPVSEWRRT